jgi:predicted enzyme related to lactoylglutathione lyase
MSSSPQVGDGAATGAPDAATVALRYEVTVLPVADVDRAKAFYMALGWRLDADFPIDEHYRIVQLTPPGSPTSIQFGTGTSTVPPGSAQDMYLAVEDIEAARSALVARGADVSEIWHGRGLGAAAGHQPGPDPERGSYRSFASFSDPDGNRWLLQEVTERLPGRTSIEVGELAELLHDAAEHHDAFEKVAPPHDWWDWYAAYMDARIRGLDQDDAAAAADRHMAEAKGVVAPSR